MPAQTLILLHTGGTIGMAPTDSGLAPISGLVEKSIQAALPEGVSLITEAFNPLIDSADITPDDWNHLLDRIAAHAPHPIIITHGTDTMAFTGAALSQALAGTDHRVILCGSMVPLNMGGDAEANLERALAAALDPNSSGVNLAFAGQILRADGLVKRDSHSHNAFRATPQIAPNPPKHRRFPRKRLAVLTLSPGIPAEFLTGALQSLDGAVLRVYGAGTAMSDPKILAAVTAAVQSGKRLRAVSQCETGGISQGSYAAGARLWAAGVENGGTQTAEAALIHLWLN
jgi:L-asparaginase